MSTELAYYRTMRTGKVSWLALVLITCLYTHKKVDGITSSLVRFTRNDNVV